MSDMFYHYGKVLGTVQRGMIAAAQRMIEGMEAGLHPPSSPNEEQREIYRARVYQKHIDSQRQIGLRHVQSEAARIRRELGF